MRCHRLSAVLIAVTVLCAAGDAPAVELDTMCFIRDTAELYQIAQAVAPEGIEITGYSAGGTCDSLTMTLVIAGSSWPVPVMMKKLSNCSLRVRASLGPVPIIDSIIDVCTLPSVVASSLPRLLRSPVFSVAAGPRTATAAWTRRIGDGELALYRLDGTLVGRERVTAGRNAHTWTRGELASGRYVCVLRGRGMTAVAEFVW